MKSKTYSEKVLTAMKKYKLNKIALCAVIGKTQPTLDSRIRKNNWRLQEVEILNELLKIK